MIDTGMLSGFVAGLSIGLGLTFLLRSKTDDVADVKRSETSKKVEDPEDEGEWEDEETDSDEGDISSELNF